MIMIFRWINLRSILPRRWSAFFETRGYTSEGIEILAYSGKSNQDAVIALLVKIYN